MPVGGFARARLPQFTDRLALGREGLVVSPFCLGLVRVPETISAAFDAGINFFFLTADMHWPLYEEEETYLMHVALVGQGQAVVEGIED